MTFEEQYLALVKRCYEEGFDKPSRGGVDQRSLFGVQMRASLQDGFPLLTGRRISFKVVAHECLWILSGNTNVRFLQNNGVHIWDKFADEEGEVGAMYQWRNWRYGGIIVDQLKNVISEIKDNPNSKRLVVSSWNVGELDQMTLPPCPHMFQFMVAGDTLHMNLSQRAGDLLLGVPYDLPVYALLTHLVGQVTGLRLGEIIYNIADCHIYHNHLDIMQKLLETETRPMPKLVLDPSIKNIDDFRYEHMRVEDYHPVSTITGNIAVGPLFQAFFYKGYRKVEKPKPKKGFKINNPYFTEIDWSSRRASDDIKNGLQLLADIEQPIISVFGSHRTGIEDKWGQHAYNLSKCLGERGYAIMTGGGPGVMYAANAGAKEVNAPSIGIRSDALIDKEAGDDSVLTHTAVVHYLFSRRFVISIKSDALVFYPGAYGTMTEFFEDVALMSANLVDVVPVVCVGKEYWIGLIDWFKEQIKKNDLADDAEKYLSYIHIEDDINAIEKIIGQRGALKP